MDAVWMRHEKPPKMKETNGSRHLTNKREERERKESTMSSNLRLWSYNNIYSTKRALTSRHRTHKNNTKHKIGTSFVVFSLILYSAVAHTNVLIKYLTNYRNTHTHTAGEREREWAKEKNPMIKLIWFLVTHQKEDVYRLLLFLSGDNIFDSTHRARVSSAALRCKYFCVCVQCTIAREWNEKEFSTEKND